MNGYKELRQQLLKSRYLHGEETESQMFKRVVSFVTKGSTLFVDDMEEEIKVPTNLLSKRLLYYYLLTGVIVYNSPILMNAGTAKPLASACYVLPLEDNMESIMKLCSTSSMIFKLGAGVGADWSNLRGKGTPVSTGGTSSGPCMFMEILDKVAEVVKSGGRRKAAVMSTMDISHPDIMDFITSKRTENKLQNMNISIRMTNDFMHNVVENPKKIARTYEGKGYTYEEIFNFIAENAWATGDPGLVFIDTINKNTPGINGMQYEAVNACSEFPLYPYESCLIGTINVGNDLFITEDKTFNTHKFTQAIQYLVASLDNTIDNAWYPSEEIRNAAKEYRRIGVSITGFGDLLIKLGIQYGSQQSYELMSELVKIMTSEANEMSEYMGSLLGEYPKSYKRSDGSKPRRNIATTVIAPAGSTSYIVGAECSGIEPMFAVVTKRMTRLEGEEEFFIVSPLFRAVYEEETHKNLTKELIEKIYNNKGSVQGLEEISETLQKLFRTANDILPDEHLHMLGVAQKYIANSVSKTINLPEEATVEDIKKIFISAWELECKGITVYRNNSKSKQVFYTDSKKTKREPDDVVNPIATPKKQLPQIMDAKRLRVATPNGNMYLLVSLLDGKPMEVFIELGKSGSNERAYTEAIGRLISLALRSNVPLNDITKTLVRIKGKEFWEFQGDYAFSIPDTIGKALRFITQSNGAEHIQEPIKEENLCPDCKSPMKLDNGCWTCSDPSCGFSWCE